MISNKGKSDKWLFKNRNEQRVDEIKCPLCGFCQSVKCYSRPRRCYVCEAPLEPDDVFYKVLE